MSHPYSVAHKELRPEHVFVNESEKYPILTKGEAWPQTTQTQTEWQHYLTALFPMSRAAFYESIGLSKDCKFIPTLAYLPSPKVGCIVELTRNQDRGQAD